MFGKREPVIQACNSPIRNTGAYQYYTPYHRQVLASNQALMEDDVAPSWWNKLRPPKSIDDKSSSYQHQQEYMIYTKQYDNQHKNNTRGLEIAGRIDVIPKWLVAMLNVGLLSISVKLNGFGSFMALGTAYRMLKAQDFVEPWLLNPQQVVEENMAKRKLAPAPPRVTAAVGAALRYLTEKSGLFFGKTMEQLTDNVVLRALGYRKEQRGKPKSSAGAFFVEKSNGMLRVILDGRWANVFFNPSCGTFHFFTLETLRSVIGNLRDDTWYAINLDLRHWFHQIPLPGQYHTYLGIFAPGRAHGDNYWLFPKALPMGWLLAPFIAQCLTWSLVLSRPAYKTGENQKGEPIYESEKLNHNEFNLPPEFFENKRTTPYTWIPLADGGGIFVFLDNILIVTPKKRIAENWFNKMIEDCDAFHAVLKGAEDEKSTILQKKQQLKKSCFFEMKKNNPHDEKHSFPFLGITWFHSSLKVEVKEESDELPGLINNNKTTWKGSRREMASILGKLNWYRRAHGISYFNKLFSNQTQAMLNIYSKLTPSEATTEKWNEPFEWCGKDEILELQNAWRKRLLEEESATTKCDFPITDEDIGFALTDAASLTRKIAIVIYSKLPQFRCPKKDECYIDSKLAEFEDNEIALGELYAILFAVQKLIERKKRLIILATDNMNCKNWIESGDAHHPKIRHVLDEIHQLLQNNNTRIYICYVPSEENSADEPSRDLKFEESKLKKNHGLLMMAKTEALGIWKISGDRTGGMKTN